MTGWGISLQHYCYHSSGSMPATSSRIRFTQVQNFLKAHFRKLLILHNLIRQLSPIWHYIL